MQRSVNVSRSPLSKLLSLRGKLRLPKVRSRGGPKQSPKSQGPPEPLCEKLSRSDEMRVTSWL